EDGVRVRLALRAFAGAVVVAELEDHVVGLELEDVGPVTFIQIALGAAAAAGHVDQVEVGSDQVLEAETPALLVGDGRITGEDEAESCVPRRGLCRGILREGAKRAGGGAGEKRDEDQPTVHFDSPFFCAHFAYSAGSFSPYGRSQA